MTAEIEIGSTEVNCDAANVMFDTGIHIDLACG